MVTASGRVERSRRAAPGRPPRRAPRRRQAPGPARISFWQDVLGRDERRCPLQDLVLHLVLAVGATRPHLRRSSVVRPSRSRGRVRHRAVGGTPLAAPGRDRRGRASIRSVTYEPERFVIRSRLGVRVVIERTDAGVAISVGSRAEPSLDDGWRLAEAQPTWLGTCAHCSASATSGICTRVRSSVSTSRRRVSLGGGSSRPRPAEPLRHQLPSPTRRAS